MQLSQFDCYSTLEDKRGQSLRDWKGGGPNGAAWNITGAPLTCRLELDAPCAGTIALRLRGNHLLLLSSSWSVTLGKNATEAELLSRVWERAPEAGPGPFELIHFSVGDLLVCQDDARTTYPFADGFVAGLASGE